MRPPCALLLSRIGADLYPTVLPALRHESAFSEEDGEGLGSDLGQDLCYVACCAAVFDSLLSL